MDGVRICEKWQMRVRVSKIVKSICIEKTYSSLPYVRYVSFELSVGEFLLADECCLAVSLNVLLIFETAV